MLKFLSGAVCCVALLGGATAKIVWQDEFDHCPGGNPDPENWGFEHGMVRNHEAQWYQPDNAKCVNGSLVITAERVTPSKSKGNAQYTSSSLITAGKHEWQYGRFEMRAKIDIRLGSWPAFWTIGNDTSKIGWPKCGEIDIMEFYRGKVLANIMYAKENGNQQWSSKTKAVDDKWSEQFHVWAMDWTEKEVSLSLDGVLMNSLPVSAAPTQGAYPNPFKQPLYIIINQALGGANGGDPSKTKFPLKYEIDYVRVYDTATPPGPAPPSPAPPGPAPPGPAPGPSPLIDCVRTCKAKLAAGCCQYDPGADHSGDVAADLAAHAGCTWHSGEHVQGGAPKPGSSTANCRSDGCDGWNANEMCGAR